MPTGALPPGVGDTLPTPSSSVSDGRSGDPARTGHIRPLRLRHRAVLIRVLTASRRNRNSTSRCNGATSPRRARHPMSTPGRRACRAGTVYARRCGIPLSGRLRAQGLRDHLRQLAHPRIAGGERCRDRVRARGAGRRHHDLRHRRRVRERGGRDRPRRGAEGRAARVAGDPHQGLLAHRAEGAQRQRALAQAHPASRSTPASPGCRPTTSISTRRTGTTTRRRSRRRCRRSPTSCARARRSTSGSASGARSNCVRVRPSRRS